MRAAVLTGREALRVEEIEIQPLSAGEVRMRIEAALTCGTDLKVFKRGYHARMIQPPSVFGHEMAGVITEIGPGCPAGLAPSGEPFEWRLGDRVVVANSAPCDVCDFCRRGQQNLCEDLQFLNGAYSESVIVPERFVRKNLLRIRTETRFESAALVEPLACVVLGAEECRIAPGARVLVIGSGPIGLLFTALARHIGCDVTVAGRGEERLRTAGKLGARRTIPVVDSGGLAGQVQAQDPQRFDVVFEAVGKPETWEASVALVRKGGLVNFFGGCPAGTSMRLDTGLMHYSSLTLKASFHHTPKTIRRALHLIETGVIQSGDFVDGHCSLSALPELFRSMAAGNRFVKTLVRVKE